MSVALSITLLGMAIVFAFIGILAVCIRFLARFKSAQGAPAPADIAGTPPLAAVIGAAVHAHRSKMKHM